MSNFKYLAIFKTPLVQGTPLKVIIDPVKIEMTREARSYRIPVQEFSVLPTGKNGLISHDDELVLQSGITHVILTARTEEKDPILGKRQCEENLDRIIANLSWIYKPEIFSDLIYRGWRLENKAGVMEAWMKLSEPVTVNEKFMEDRLKEINRNQTEDPEMFERIKLMSRFYTKSISISPSEEKYLLLWTILEVYPMKDTTNIKPISEILSIVTGHQVQDVKDKLDIGRLYGTRCKLVHDGVFDIPIQDMGAVFAKLETIIYEIFRYASKLPSAHSLDAYFT